MQLPEEDQLPPPFSPSTLQETGVINEPNSPLHLQQPEEELVPISSSARIRPRPVVTARAAAAQDQHDVTENESRTGSEPVPRAAAATAPPRRFTRPGERKKPDISYAASLSAILQQHVGTENLI